MQRDAVAEKLSDPYDLRIRWLARSRMTVRYELIPYTPLFTFVRANDKILCSIILVQMK